MGLLDNKAALITGGASGIGKAIAHKFSDEGALIAICDIDSESAEKTAAEIEKSAGKKAAAYPVDVSRTADVAEAVSKIIDDFGRIDILVNNAGITRDGLIVRMSEDDWDNVLDINLKGCFNFIKAAARQMMKQRSGKIISIASVIGMRGNAGQANYAASKAGVIGLSKSIAKELAPRGINVNAIAPGYIETPMTEALTDEQRKMMLEHIALRKFGRPDDVANAALFLASGLSDYVTGQVIVVDGGIVL